MEGFVEVSDGVEIYYETHGEGEPVVFLNGIMMNTKSWGGLLPLFSEKFKLILFDFRDQAQSTKMEQQYSLDQHAEDLLGLLNELDISKAHLMGPSYGGNVALKFALSHQDRVKSLILPHTTNFHSNHLKEIGTAWEVAAKLNNAEKFFQLAIPYIYGGSFYETSLDWLRERQEMFKDLLTKEWFESFIRLMRSTENYYISPEELQKIRVPTLLIGAEEDILTPIRYMKTIYENVENCEFVTIPEAGHASFLEKTQDFSTIVMGFIFKHT